MQVGSQFQELAKGVSSFANDLSGGNATAQQVSSGPRSGWLFAKRVFQELAKHSDMIQKDTLSTP